MHPFVFISITAAVGFLCLGFASSESRYIDQWAAECHSKGGAVVYVYTNATFSKRINCLDAKRVDMRDNDQ